MTPSFRVSSYDVLWWSCAFVGVPYFRPRIEGRRHVVCGEPFIVACNHVTLLDWAALAYGIPRQVRFLVTRAYYDRPALHWFCRHGGAIPVRRGRIEPSAFRAAETALRAGEVVGVFPEGRLSLDGRLLAPERGVIGLAQRCRVPIVPATIRGAFRAFPPTARVPRPRRITVAFGEPFYPTAFKRADHHTLAEDLMRRIASLGADPTPVAPSERRTQC
jgi:1-acyl-sn-glycerol-3-phosphate acyltransferase